MRTSLVIAYAAVFTSLAVLVRYAKNALTTVQFVNFPLMFTMLSGMYFGTRVGGLVGFLSFFISDLLIIPGPWTLVNSLLAGLIGILWGLLKNISNRRIEMFVLAYLSTFLYDILSSVILYVVFGLDLTSALIFGIIGLFLPVFGGSLIGVGPITEASTATLVCLLSQILEKRGVINR
ncbi:MAG: hypothetical protein DRJ51_06065 [Thermoprotei archaeon]|nr:MAG: hypothetical protein DRJ51_06065 [Thermoprotei archaeon]RLF01586.1 MAG: hypothetical protein DRJ59_05740 [Thermoprotei archaeon]